MQMKSASCWYLLVEIGWSGQSAGAVSDAGLTAANWDAVVLWLFEPAGVPPVGVVVNAAAVELECCRSESFSGVLWSLRRRGTVAAKLALSPASAHSRWHGWGRLCWCRCICCKPSGSSDWPGLPPGTKTHMRWRTCNFPWTKIYWN